MIRYLTENDVRELLTMPDAIRLVEEALEDRAEGRAVDTLIRNFRRDGQPFWNEFHQPFWNEFHLAPVRNPAGRLTHYIGYQLDVTDRIERDHQLERLAS